MNGIVRSRSQSSIVKENCHVLTDSDENVIISDVICDDDIIKYVKYAQSLEDKRGSEGPDERTDDFTESSENETSNPGLGKNRRWEDASAWLLLFRVFLFNAICGITWVTFSLYYVEYTRYFNAPKATVGWISAIQTTFSFIMGIFIAVPMEIFPAHYCAAFGAFIFSLGLGLSSLSPSIPVLFITQGFIAGFGFSFLHVVPAVVLQQHFHINRTMANGLSYLGYSLGLVGGPPLINYLITEYGWRGSILLQSAISLNTVPLGLTLWSPAGFNPGARRTRRNFRDLVCNALDFTLLRQPTFALYFVAVLFGRYHNTALLTHYPSRAVHVGVSLSDAARLITITFICQSVTRLTVTILGNIPGCNRVALSAGGYLIEGLADVMMLSIPGYAGCLAGAVFFGVGMGIFNTLLNVVVVDLLGVERLARGLGLVMFSQSFTLLTAAPFTGYLYDVTGSYDVPLYISCLSNMICVSLLIVVVILRCYHVK